MVGIYLVNVGGLRAVIILLWLQRRLFDLIYYFVLPTLYVVMALVVLVSGVEVTAD